MNLRPPLFAFFLLVTCVALATIGVLVAWLDSYQTDAARTAADASVRAVLLHGTVVVAEPLWEVQRLVRQMASFTRSTQSYCNDGRNTTRSMTVLNRQYLGSLLASPIPYLMYQVFAVDGDWTYCGCSHTECLFYANGHSIATAPDYPVLSYDQYYNDSDWKHGPYAYIKVVSALTRADQDGVFDFFEIDEVSKLLLGVYVPLLFDASGRCVLAEGIDLQSTDLRDRLLNLTLPDTSVALLDTNRHTLLATTAEVGRPNNAQWFRNATDNTEKLWQPQDIPNAAMRSAVLRLPTLDLARPVVLDDGGDIVGGITLRIRNLNLTIVTVTSRSLFYKPVDQTRVSGAIIGCVGALLCVLISAVVCVLVHRALAGLREAMVPAARLQLCPEDLRALGRCPIRDVAALQESFEAMNARLCQAAAYIPHTVRTAWDDEDAEEDDPCEIPPADDIAFATPPSTALGLPPARSHSPASGPSVPAEDALRMGTTRDLTLYAPHHLAATSTVQATLLAVNIRGFAHLATALVPAEVHARLEALTAVVFDAAVNHSGVLDSFQGDRFLVTFNASSPTTAHALHAAQCALEIHRAVAQGALQDSSSAPTPRGGPSPRLEIEPSPGTAAPTVSCGLATGPLVVGDIGCKEMKRFGLIGHAFTRALALERLCCSYGPTEYCAVAAPSFEELGAHVALTPVDHVRLPGASRAAAIGVLGAEHERGADDEDWLYVADQRPPEGAGAVLAHIVRGDTGAAQDAWDKLSRAVDPAVGLVAEHVGKMMQQLQDGRHVAHLGRDLGEFYHRVVAKQL